MKRLHSWWHGEYLSYDNDPSSGIIVVGGYFNRHWTSRAAHCVVNFLRAEWKWAIGTVLACVGLAMTYIRFF